MSAPPPSAGRLFLVSNRLPVTLSEGENGLEATLSAGGLATGLVGLHQESGGGWIGWPGLTTADGTLSAEVQEALRARDLIGVGLSEEEHRGYYQKLSNQCIWPLFHYFKERMHFDDDDWEQYVAINRRFADAVLAEVEDEDVVFVQDFHLMLLPAMLREARPNLRIGFFLHIPFPSSEVFRIFPRREEMLRGVLGADYIAFHTMGYLRHFRSSVCHLLGLETRTSSIDLGDRSVRLDSRPLPIDGWRWGPGSEEDEQKIADYQKELAEMADGRQLVLGVERMDYTKGIPERLIAVKDFLAEDPSRVDRMFMVQVAVPSRAEVDDYRELKDEVDRLAGSINSEFGRPGRLPLHYLYQSVPPWQLRALYRSADVALVTPLRDGLNLVAKEYVASRLDNDGALVLGESTGAAWELGEALRVNPYDPDAMCRALGQALDMSKEEQVARMAPMRERVLDNDIEKWARGCLHAIRRSHRVGPAPLPLDVDARQELLENWQRGTAPAILLLDYDGTLQPFAQRPEGAIPDPELLSLLRRLAELPQVEPWVVSGRPPEVLAEWLGATGVGFVAEHGAYLRKPGATEFESLLDNDAMTWQDDVRPILERFVGHVPGSLIEEKAVGLAWHYREADPVLGAWQARELFQHLTELLPDQGVQVMRGNKVIEVRPASVSKGMSSRRILKALDPAKDRFLLAAGDDITDESLFRMLPDSAWTLLVGSRKSQARFRLENPAELRALLTWLADCPPPAPSAASSQAAGSADRS